MKQKIGIIGGSGFVGSSLARYLSTKFQVKILDVHSPPKYVEGLVTQVQCDIRDFEDVRGKLEDVDLVIHTAIVQIPLINEEKSLGYAVNILGTQNVCKAVEKNPKTKGMILAGTWHTIGERDLKGIIDEEFGFRPDKVEDRAKLYALSKMAQEAIVRYFDEISDKIYGVVRMGTVLGADMPSKTAAHVFVERGLRGESITPFKHSMYRPMLYVDVRDVCRVFEIYAKKILGGTCKKGTNSLDHIVNVYYPNPITILELADIVRKLVIECTKGKVKPDVEIQDKGEPLLFDQRQKDKITVNVNKIKKFLGVKELISPEESLRKIIEGSINSS